MNRIVAFVWGGTTLAVGWMALSIALGPKGDASGWVMAAVFAGVAVFCAWRTWREWVTPDVETRLFAQPVVPEALRAAATDAPGAWRGPDIPLETQIAALREAGLAMAPGRTVAELLVSWPRADYESDPYGLILFMYGSDVEAEPWERAFCERGWNFDMECLVQAGDYVRALTPIMRTTGQLDLVTQMSDDFDIEAETAEINYVIAGRPRTIRARVDGDWADPEALAAFLADVEDAIGDGRRFWAADNGQASILFFLTDAEAGKVNALREDVLVRYAAG
jgi:hypothetical protein